MTSTAFDALASTPRRATPRPSPETRTVVRLAWLIVKLTTSRPVRFDDDRVRFDRSLRTYRRDIATLRDAGISIDLDVHGSSTMLWFCSERGAA